MYFSRVKGTAEIYHKTYISCIVWEASIQIYKNKQMSLMLQSDQSWQNSPRAGELLQLFAIYDEYKISCKTFLNICRMLAIAQSNMTLMMKLGQDKSFPRKKQGICFCGLWFGSYLTINATAGQWKDCMRTGWRVLRCDAIGRLPMYLRWNKPTHWTF